MENKPGIKTTEFWLCLIAIVAVNLGAAFSGQQWALIAAIIGDALIAMGYGHSRATVKANGNGANNGNTET